MSDLYDNNSSDFITAIKAAIAAKYTQPEGGIPSGDLTTALQEDIATAIEDAAAAYLLPEAGIPGTDLTAEVQASLALADTAMQGTATITDVQGAKITLNGTAQTPVLFSGAVTAATLVSTVDFSTTIDLNTLPTGTLIFTTDGTEQTMTLAGTSGTSVSGSSPSTDISGGADTKIKIQVDGDTAEEVALTLAGLTTGAAIATELQTKIRAKGGSKANITVAYTSVYTITSHIKGTGSSVVVTAPTSGSLLEELKLGTVGGGTETAGTGSYANDHAVTRAELMAAITAQCNKLTVATSTNYIRITSKTTGTNSSIVAGNGTLKTAIGFAQNAASYGSATLGFAKDMNDTNYFVALTMDGTAGASLVTLGTSSKATTGFTIEQSGTSTGYVDAIIIGKAAA